MAVLVNNLGGPVGFGENYVERNDDDYTDAIDITGGSKNLCTARPW